MSNKYPISMEWQDGGYRVVIDEELDETSSNPVANWVVKKAIDEGGGGGGGGVANITSNDKTVTVTTGSSSVDLSVAESLDGKVDKEAGKTLSSNDYTDDEKNKLSGIEAGAQKNLPNTVTDANYVHTDNNYTTTEKNKLAGIEAGAEKNLPNTVTDADYVHTDNNYTDDDKNKLDAIDTDKYLEKDTTSTNTLYATNTTAGSQRQVPFSSAANAWNMAFRGENGTLQVGTPTANNHATTKKYVDDGLSAKADSADLATVATSGSYNDLSDKPTIPAAQVNSDWNATSGVAQILNKPTIPAAQVNSDWKATSGVAQILNKPTKVSEFTNDSGFQTSSQVSSAISTHNSSTTAHSDIRTSVSNISDVIPSDASATNQLADRAFVNSSLNSVTAYYITKNAAGEQFNTKAELTAATKYYSGGEERTPTRNDYCIVLKDESKDNATTRYIYQNGKWEFQYVVNETALTADQLAAINSGITSAGVTKLNGIEAGAQKNLANTVVDANYVHTDNNYTTTEKNKLSGIASGAEVNVQSDWNVTDTTSDAFIKNKPTIPAAQVNSDWNATSGVAQILNKPTIPAAQVNSDWNATSGKAQILNKPSLATVATSGSYNDLSNKPTIPDVSTKTNTSVLPNNASNTYSKFRCKAQGYTGSGSTIQYCKIAKLPKSDGSNGAHVIIEGEFGGYGAKDRALFRCLVANRDSVRIFGDTEKPDNDMTAVYERGDIVAYQDTDGTVTIYFRRAGYYVYDFNVFVHGDSSNTLYDGTVVTPTGTEVGKLSTTTYKLEMYGGKLYIGGDEVALAKNVPDISGYLPLTGGTLTGNTTISKSSDETKYIATRTDTNRSVWVGVGSGGTNAGLYDVNSSSWLLYDDKNATYLPRFKAGTSNIADGAVTTAKIADANVTTAKIADSNVTTAKLANNAVTLAKLAQYPDTRNDNQPPSWYFTNYGRKTVTEFKYCNKIGVEGFFSGTYCTLITFVQWTDNSGGYPTQIAVSYGNTGKMVIRSATSNTAWGVWKDVNTSRTLTQAQYDALSDTEKMNGTEYFISDAGPSVVPRGSVLVANLRMSLRSVSGNQWHGIGFVKSEGYYNSEYVTAGDTDGASGTALKIIKPGIYMFCPNARHADFNNATDDCGWGVMGAAQYIEHWHYDKNRGGFFTPSIVRCAANNQCFFGVYRVGATMDWTNTDFAKMEVFYLGE